MKKGQRISDDELSLYLGVDIDLLRYIDEHPEDNDARDIFLSEIDLAHSKLEDLEILHSFGRF